jgi:hypothetical protein
MGFFPERLKQRTEKQKTAGLCSVGGWVGSVQVLARLPLIRLGQRTRTKSKKQRAKTWAAM